MRKWISVNDELPIDLGEVHCWNDELEIDYGLMYYDERDKTWRAGESGCINNEYDKPPTHWCQQAKLPKFPKK